MHEEILKDALDFAYSSGLLIKRKSDSTATHAPFSLFPSNFPKQLFNLAIELQPLMNKLVHEMSINREFVGSVVEQIGNDDFIQNLYQIYVNSKLPEIFLGIHRSDYMISGDRLLQVENNTISCGLVTLGQRVSILHQTLSLNENYGYKIENIPTNNSHSRIPFAISQASLLFQQKYKINNPPLVLFIVQDPEWNVFDQRGIEYELLKYDIKVIRMTLTELSTNASLIDNNLVINNEIISVVYFRAGYTPLDYPLKKHWDVRMLIEQSSAVCVPNIGYHLVGSKKFQQVISDPNILETFLNKQECQLVSSVFAGLYSLDDSVQGSSNYQKALTNSDKLYVLKSNREGGGNNVYGNKIPDYLNSLTVQERTRYILMDLIVPPSHTSFMVREGVVFEKETCSELGIFGIYLKDANSLINESAGHLLRTKDKELDEGGVSIGSSVIDSPYLV